ncbi:cupin domain-containing protein [Oligosphaera ethanolica]|uniref:Quercetin dioxygenase-like cupin family protein n=1 Tax=Oligosphaera ethanolica TaxID=760260 RepID=A0AAE4AMV6_9BACT|nr:cupin domain-containing protein [Oligosphaera ethanolica]MDQ0289719.1 quercetin dioxygenase-like cupin family protein [Oligosphaera ethanolica]
MKIVHAKKVPSVENPHKVQVGKLYDTEHAQVMHITLEPGQSLKRHITPVDVFFYVLEGTGIVEIGDVKQEVGPDTLIDSPARIPHCWYNESASIVRILVVKVPRPTETTRIL